MDEPQDIGSAKLMEIVGDELWWRTKTDWVLTVSHDLTEPTCPTAAIEPADEDDEWQIWRADRNTIEGAIEAVLAIAHAALFSGSEETGVPWTNPKRKPIPPSPTARRPTPRQIMDKVEKVALPDARPTVTDKGLVGFLRRCSRDDEFIPSEQAYFAQAADLASGHTALLREIKALREALALFTGQAVFDPYTHRVSVDEFVVSKCRAVLTSKGE